MIVPLPLLLIAFGVALVLSAILTPAARQAAIRLGAIDTPDPRKIHTTPVPRMGGVGVASAATVAVALALYASPTLRSTVVGSGWLRWTVLGLAVLAILFMGAVDDVRGLSARVKFAIEIAAAAVVVLVADLPKALDLTPFPGSLELGVLGPVFGILWIVALTNAVNMTDVVDGVAAGLGAVAAAALAFVSLALGNVVAPVVLLALSGALVGFLPHNFRNRAVFLGDSGSLTVGFVLGSATLVGLERDGSWVVLPAVLALGLILGELGLTMLRRTLRALAVSRAEGRRERFVMSARAPALFTPDRRHIPHRLLELGLSTRAAVGVLCLIGGALGALGFATVRWPWLGPLGALVVTASLAYFAPRWLYDELRVLQRGAFLPLLESRLVHNRAVHALYDSAAVATSYLLSAALVHGPAALLAEGPVLWLRTAAVAIATVAGFWLAGLYPIAYRFAGLPEALHAGRAVLFGVVLGAGANAVAFGLPLSVALWILHFYLVLTAVVGVRLSFRFLDHMHQRGRVAGRRALIFGAGRAGTLALREILANPTMNVVPVGFVDDDAATWHREVNGLPVHAGPDGLDWLLQTLRVDELIVSTDKLDAARLAALEGTCRAHGVRLVRFRLQWDDTPADGTKLPDASADTAARRGA